MLQRIFMALSLALVPAFACAQQAPSVVIDGQEPPVFRAIGSYDEAKKIVRLEETVVKFMAVIVERTVIVDGIEQKRMETQLVPTFETAERTFALATGRVFTPSGKEVPADKLAERLKRGAVVLVAPSGKVSERLAAILKDDALILAGQTEPPLNVPVKTPGFDLPK